MGNIVNRVFDSAGPEGKVRGTPQQIIEKYQSLARDAQLSNDRVAAENFLQHSEHYSRMLGEALVQQAEQRQSGDVQQGDRTAAYEGYEGQENAGATDAQQPQYTQNQPRDPFEQSHAQEQPFEADKPQPETVAFDAVEVPENGDLVSTPESPQPATRNRSRGGQNRGRRPIAPDERGEQPTEAPSND